MHATISGNHCQRCVGADWRGDIDRVGFDLRQHVIKVRVHRRNAEGFCLRLCFLDEGIANRNDLAIGHLLPAR